MSGKSSQFHVLSFALVRAIAGSSSSSGFRPAGKPNGEESRVNRTGDRNYIFTGFLCDATDLARPYALPDA
jgi:hypothetical protein